MKIKNFVDPILESAGKNRGKNKGEDSSEGQLPSTAAFKKKLGSESK